MIISTDEGKLTVFNTIHHLKIVKLQRWSDSLKYDLPHLISKRRKKPYISSQGIKKNV